MKLFIFLLLSLFLFEEGLYSNTKTNKPLIVGGTVSGSTTVCSGSNSGALNLTGNNADVIRWEYSLTGGAPWTTINYTERNFPYENLTVTTYFRAVVSDGIDVVYSTTGIITVSSLPAGGTIVGETQECSGANGTLVLSDYSGSIIRWEYSTTPGSWSTISNTTNEYTYSNLQFDTEFRAIVQTTGCSETTSNEHPITINQPTVGGSLDGSTTVCKNTNSTTLTLNSATGQVISWETSLSGNSPWTTVSGSDGRNSLTFNNLISTTFYRAIVESPGCSTEYSSVASIAVDEQTETGYLIGADEICATNNSGMINLVGNKGDIVNWEYSENNGTSWTTILNSVDLTQHTYNDLTTTTSYRAQVKNGVCDAQYTPSAEIKVNPLPIVSFSVNNVCQSKKSHLTNKTNIAEGYIQEYTWVLGDGNRAYIKNPVYKYASSGVYEVKLSAVSNKGCVDSVKQDITIYPLPNVSFNATNVCNAEQTTFVNHSTISSGTISHFWDFGDASGTSINENPVYTYSATGNYDVKLKVTSNYGCIDSATNSIEVFPFATPDFSFDDVCDGTEVQFSNNSTISSGNFTCNWDFGNGQNSTQYNPKHLYQSAGVYNVRLTVTSSENCLQEITKEVNVNPVPNTNFAIHDTCAQDQIYLNNLTTISSGNVTYFWNFGDGATSGDAEPTYNYRIPGNYLISLEGQSDKGCKKSTSQNINIFPIPKADFIAENACYTDSVKFTNLSNISSGTLSYTWSFGDESSSGLLNPSHYYNSASQYNVALNVVSDNGCYDNFNKFIEVYPKPEADFFAPTFCDGSELAFVNLSSVESGTITNYLWDFGDGTNSVQEEPVKLYFNPDEYTVTLQVITEFGCSDTTSRSFRPNANPVANFSVENVCHNKPIYPNNSTENDGSLRFNWSFGDGNVSTLNNPEHTYSLAGIYSITLTAITVQGCVDSLKRNVIIYPLPNTFAGNDTTVSRGYPLILSADGGNEFTWLPTTGLSDPFIKSPTARLDVTTTFSLQSENEFGCINYDTITIQVLDDYKIEASNIVTPNQDGYNDYWMIYNIETFDNCLLNIYDRWGKLVYHTKAYQNNWDGRNMNNDILPDGTYYYIIEFEGASKTYKGAITILRDN